jgi:hypothetical protein
MGLPLIKLAGANSSVNDGNGGWRVQLATDLAGDHPKLQPTSISNTGNNSTAAFYALLGVLVSSITSAKLSQSLASVSL